VVAFLLLTSVIVILDEYNPAKDNNIPVDRDYRELARDSIFYKGQSHRIWGELFKVLDSSDVVIEVLDARDPMGTRAFHVEEHIKKQFGFSFFLVRRSLLWI
jgi:hypothetical protein